MFQHHAPAGYICPFCLVVQGIEDETVLTRQADVVWHGPETTAFICSHHFARNPGHTLVVPNLHYEHIYELPAQLGHAVFTTAQGVARAMKPAFGCAGVYLSQANEPAGNQTVWHYHMHVIPRFHDDAFFDSLVSLETCYTIMPPTERAAYAHLLRAQLAEQQV